LFAQCRGLARWKRGRARSTGCTAHLPQLRPPFSFLPQPCRMSRIVALRVIWRDEGHSAKKCAQFSLACACTRFKCRESVQGWQAVLLPVQFDQEMLLLPLPSFCCCAVSCYRAMMVLFRGAALGPYVVVAASLIPLARVQGYGRVLAALICRCRSKIFECRFQVSGLIEFPTTCPVRVSACRLACEPQVLGVSGRTSFHLFASCRLSSPAIAAIFFRFS